jgi:hypothetical protein
MARQDTEMLTEELGSHFAGIRHYIAFAGSGGG